MRSTTPHLLAASVLALAAANAQADVVRLDNFTYSPATSITVNTPGYSGQAGQFSGLRDGNSFLTYCTDLLQYFNFGVTYNNYSVVSGVTAFGAAKSNDLDRVMSTLMSPGVVHDAATSASAQAMIWEVLYESSGTYNLAAGSFKASSAHVATQNALNAMTWDAFAVTPIRYHVDKLFSSTNQDFLVVSSVPEPSSLALLATAGVALFWVGRRNRRQG